MGTSRRPTGNMTKRFLATVGITAVALGGGGATPASADFQTLTENVAGGLNSSVTQWSYAKTQQIANSIYNRQGDFVGFQEICRGQLKSVADDLYLRLGRSFSYYHQVNATASDYSGLGSGQCTYPNNTTAAYGNGILLPRPAVSLSFHVLADDGSAGQNGVICAETSAESRAVNICSTHFSPPDRDGSGAIRQRQAEQTRDIAVAKGQWQGVVVAGDMNIKPGESYIQPLYSRLREVDQYSSSINTANSYTFTNKQTFGTIVKKIDYIFYGDYRVGSPTGARVEPVKWSVDENAFDHRFLPALEMFMRPL